MPNIESDEVAMKLAILVRKVSKLNIELVVYQV